MNARALWVQLIHFAHGSAMGYRRNMQFRATEAIGLKLEADTPACDVHQLVGLQQAACLIDRRSSVILNLSNLVQEAV